MTSKLIQATIIAHGSHTPMAMKFKAAVLAQQVKKS